MNIGVVNKINMDLLGKAALDSLPDFTLLKDFISQFDSQALPKHYSVMIDSHQSTPVERNGLLELDLKTNIPFRNPYDPKAIDLKVLFTAPSGRQAAVGAFWYQGFDQQTREASGKAGWKARFTPNEIGEWTAIAIAPAVNAESSTYSFRVVSSPRTGFIHIDPTNSHYLATDDGNFFFPIGVNMAWWEEGSDPLVQYRQWLKQFSENGGNTIRVWMAAWSFGIEWEDTGLGNYNDRLYEAWLLDQLFEMAGEYNVKIILVLMNHGTLSLTANSEWNENPYSNALGGPLASPSQFVTNPLAKTYFKQRLGYIINRWAYSPDLLAWEWFNEVDLTPITDNELLPWLKEMTAYLRERDIYHHLTTNSFSVRSWSDSWHLPELDIVQIHEYADKLDSGERDPVNNVGNQYQSIARDLPKKPVLLGEFGYSSRQNGEKVEETGIQLHNGLWATTFSGYAGSGMYWWWDTYIAPNNLWYHFKGLADFLIGEDLGGYKPVAGLQIVDDKGIKTQEIGLGLQGKTTLVWIRSEDYTVDASIEAKQRNPNASTYTPQLKKGLFLILDHMETGMYTVDWYDPQKAQWLSQVNITATNHQLRLPIPSFKDDLAAKINRIP